MDLSSLDKKLQGFQLIAQEKLQAILCSIPGKKDLIIEPGLIKSLEHICAASWLKLKGIQRIFKLDSSNAITRSSADQVQLYMIRSDLATFCRVMDQIKLIRKSETNNAWSDDANLNYFHVLCIPSCFAYFQRLLEHEGLYGIVELHRYCWDFIHLDEGVLSMEVPNVFSSAYMRSDCSLMSSISHSLRVLHILCGRPQLILTYGEHSANILKMLDNLGPLPKCDEDKEVDFSAMIIIDRDKDFASPLLTPAIYAGLLMEVFNNNAGTMELDLETNKIKQQKLSIFAIPVKKEEESKSQTSGDKRNVKPATIRLNGTQDDIYAENRYKHFAAASSQIRQQAKSISMELQKLNNMKLDEMHDYVNRKLPKITELKNKLVKHLNASEKVIEMLGSNYRRVQTLEEDILNNVSRKKILGDIDELLTADGQRYNTLRLLCLLHICAGISSEELSNFIRNYCNYFGLKYLSTFQHFAHVGLLPAVSEEPCTTSVTTPLNKTATKLLSNIPLNIPKFHQTTFQANANRLKLMVTSAGAEDMDTIAAPSASFTSPSSASSSSKAESACPSYVFNRLYIPLVAQLCSFLLKANSTDEFVQKLSMIDHMKLNGQPLKSFSQSVRLGDTKELLPLAKRNLIVYVVGGVTFAEIAACNLIGKSTESQVFITSDCILSGADLIAGAF